MTEKEHVESEEREEAPAMPGSLDEVIRSYMPLVRHVVQRLVTGGTTRTFLDYEDLLSCAVQGLIEAHRSFDSTRGVKFSTFALPRIRGAVLDALRKAHPLPRSLQRSAAVIAATTNLLSSELGRPPTETEVADRLGVTIEHLARVSQSSNVKAISLEVVTEMTAGGSPEKLAGLADEDIMSRPEALIEEHLTRNQLRLAIAALPPRERAIIDLFYLESRSLKSIASLLGVSESRVSQLRHRGIRMLRVALHSQGPMAA